MSNKILPRGTLSAVRPVDLVDFGARIPSADRVEHETAPDETTAECRDQTAFEQIRQQAYLEGVEAGRREMHAAVERERAELGTLAANLDSFCKELDARLADEVLGMSLEMARLIVRHGLRLNPELVLPALREALASLPGVGADTVLFLHPEDHVLLRNTVQADGALALPWKVIDDPQLERGGCRIETPTTEVDATLETRWKRVISALGRDDAWAGSIAGA